MLNTLKVADFLRRKRVPIAIEPEREYSLVTIKLYHKGVVLREKKKGALLGSKMYQISKGDFILSGIDARNGAFGIVPEELDGAIVTNDFWYFDIDESLVKRDFFFWLTTTPLFLDACQKSSKGETQRIRLQKKLFDDFIFHFPPVEMQDIFLSKISIVEDSITALQSENQNQFSYLTQLRQAILQEAIEGKLTADWQKKNPVRKGDPDYDAEALLEKIKAEKERQVKEGKIKKEKFQESILEHKIKIHNTWTLPLLGEISKQITDGTHQTPTYTTVGRIFLSAQNVKPFKFMPENYKLITEKAYNDYRKNKIPEMGDLLIGRVGAGIGETAVIDKEIDFAFYVSLGLVKTFKELTLPEYLTIVSNSPYGVRYSKGNISSGGTSAGNYNLGRIRSLEIPLPPFAEQQAIVDRVEKLLSMVDELEKQVSERKEWSEQLMQAVLREAFEGGQ